MKRNNIICLSLALLAAAILTNACSKDDDEGTVGTDTMLLEMAKQSSGFVWFGNSDTLLPKSSGTGHSEPLLRTRYNDVAAAMLDADGRILPGATFPEGSLVVKELYEDASTLGRYAILFKQPSHPDADADGWVWGYILANGSVALPASSKGSGCRGCHGQAEHIDFNLMNKYF